MKREDALEISNLAGFMLMYVEQFEAKRLGVQYPLPADLFIAASTELPFNDRMLLERLRDCRKAITDKVVALIDDGTKSAADVERELEAARKSG